MPKSRMIIVALLLSLVLVLPALAFEGKVAKIDGATISLSVEGPLPPWVKKGALAKTSSGLGKVTDVTGQTIEMKVRNSTAEGLKLGEMLDIKPKDVNPAEMLQGC